MCKKERDDEVLKDFGELKRICLDILLFLESGYRVAGSIWSDFIDVSYIDRVCELFCWLKLYKKLFKYCF